MIRKQKRKNNKGFSLVELIIVIAIMAILAGVLAPQFVRYINRGRVSTDIQNAQQIASALSVYFADHQSATTEYTEVREGANMPGDNPETIENVLGAIPEVRAEGERVFAFSIGNNGQVTVWIVHSTGGSADNGVELYPNIENGSTWDQDN